MVLTAKKAAKYKNVLRRSIAAGHNGYKQKCSSSTLDMAVAVRKSTEKKSE